MASAVAKLRECSICLGPARIRCAFGMSITNPKCVWIECECGHRSPMCSSMEEAVKWWNWMNRETPSDAIKATKKAEEHARIKAEIETAKAKTKIIEEPKKRKRRSAVVTAPRPMIDDSVLKQAKKKRKVKPAGNTPPAVSVVEKPKRHRRKKAEMIAYRASLAAQK